jgi:hypothetical protein
MDMKKSFWLSSPRKSSFPSNDFRSFDYRGAWQKQFINHYVQEGFLHGFDKATVKFSNHKDEHLPKSLYKFFPPTTNSLIGMVNRSLWLSTPNCFNDPFDSYIGIEEGTFIKTYILKNLKRNGLIAKHSSKDKLSEEECWRLFCSHSKDTEPPFLSNKKLFYSELLRIKLAKNAEIQMVLNRLWCNANAECTKKIREIRNIPFRIACFSNFEDDEELGMNTTMWSHYADNHKGFCVKYSLNFADSPIQSILKCGLFKVIYSAKISNASPRELLKLEYDRNNEIEVNSYLMKTIYRALITKARFWNYEKEWRLILGKENFKILNDGSIPFPFIEAIYLGCKIEKTLKEYIVQFAKPNNISVHQAIQSSERFILKFYDARNNSG